ncbi:FadR family transcriptional regulator [Phaeobacter inhibens]|nr:FadR family transcriptional regulator [Phaeobacter inhibens]
MQGLERISASSKSDAVADQLLSFFRIRQYQAGDKLPSEFELMDALGVGRSSIREAVRKLQAINVLDVRRGSGTYLRRIAMDNEILVPLAIGQERESLLMALDIRRGLEAEAAALACTRGSDEDIDHIRVSLEEMERVHMETGAAVEEDLAFHLSIYRATGNAMFEQVISEMRGPFVRFFEQPFDRDDFGTRSFPLHRELYEAIASRNVELSRAKSIELLSFVELDIREMSVPDSSAAP